VPNGTKATKLCGLAPLRENIEVKEPQTINIKPQTSNSPLRQPIQKLGHFFFADGNGFGGGNS
jgi:hypothetical protein